MPAALGARIGQGDPGQSPGAGLLLQDQGLLALGGDQHGAGAAGRQGGRQGIAGFQKAQLSGRSLIQGVGTLDLRIVGQVSGGGLSHFAEAAEQCAETHAPVLFWAIVGRP
jgi:hypothetical protein